MQMKKSEEKKEEVKMTPAQIRFAQIQKQQQEKNLKLLQQVTDNSKIKDSDFDPFCTICMNVMVEPCRAPCGHIFCKHCLANNIEVNHECPLCREPIKLNFRLSIEKKLDSEIQRRLPEKYAKSKMLLEQANDKDSFMIEVEFEVGNLHQNLMFSKNRFTPFLRIKEEVNRKALCQLVSSVKFATFDGQRKRRIESKPKDGDEMVSASWISYDATTVKYIISWTPESEMQGVTEVEHNMEDQDNWRTVKISMDSRVIEKHFEIMTRLESILEQDEDSDDLSVDDFGFFKTDNAVKLDVKGKSKKISKKTSSSNGTGEALFRRRSSMRLLENTLSSKQPKMGKELSMNTMFATRFNLAENAGATLSKSNSLKKKSSLARKMEVKKSRSIASAARKKKSSSSGPDNERLDEGVEYESDSDMRD